MTAAIYIIPVLVFGAILFLVLGILQYLSYRRGRSDLLRKIEEEGRKESDTEPFSLRDRLRQFFVSLTQGLGPLAKPKKEEEISRLRLRFMQAGLSRFKNVAMVFLGSKVLLMVLLPALFAAFKFSIFKSIPPMRFIFVVVALALIGFYIPELWLKIRIENRKDKVLRGFPDGLDLMVICTEAGMGLDAAVSRVGEEMKLRHPVFSEELKILTLELRAGKLRSDALKSLGVRTDSEDIQSFATLLIQTEKFGTNIAQAMRVQADSMRVKRTQKVEELAAKLAIKLLFPTILFIFPSLFLVIIGPALIQAFRVWKG